MKGIYFIWKSVLLLVLVILLTAYKGDKIASDTAKKETSQNESLSYSTSGQKPNDLETRPAVKSFELLTSNGIN